jgi:SAM-dependent methyltransferase
MTRIWHENKTCRACGSGELELVLSLGETPLANRYLTQPQLSEPEPQVRLATHLCRNCYLMQLLDVVEPDVLFSNYLYVPSASETLRRHFGGLAAELKDVAELNWGDLVVEIASNDGLLLKQIRDLGLQTLGVEPATNIAATAQADGQDVVNAFFDSETASRLKAEGRSASAVVGTNVLAHVDRVRDFLAGVELLLKPGGTACFEVPHLLELLDKTEFDTIYHEHLSYFSLHALMRLFASVGLTLFRFGRPPIHGGSLRVYARKGGAAPVSLDPSVGDLLKEEEERGITRIETYRQFADRVEGVRRDLGEMLASIKSDGRRIAAYGAAAKGMTLLAYCDLGSETLDYVIDKSPYKQGHWTPGNHLPIHGVDKLLAEPPDYLLILAWNFSEEIISQQQAYRQSGGKFIIPIPSPAIV